ncbi:MAG: cytochrome-c oxidase, cbb3-type subunit I [Polyangiaceae bacterium]
MEDATAQSPSDAPPGDQEVQKIRYDDSVVRAFLWASVGWGIVGMLVGVIVALQLAWWPANVHTFLTFGRLRPLHTNAVIFAFVGNMVFAGIYHSSQRLLKARMASDRLSWFHFYGWQTIIVAAAITLPLGYTQGKEYAELEWPIDIAIAVVWVAFAINYFWTLAKRNEKHLYVAIWFYIASIVTVAVLHVVNSVAIPVFALKSYSAYGGAQDALVQWWYGHNAVAFFLTTPVLGIMYYYLPKAADRPVFSYRLSIIHFWALIFLYIWAGPHHLLNTALPNWAQSLGMVFSVMLWAPSWGGMINGLFTLRGAWDKLREDPVLKFFAAGVTFYGMATFEGPLLSIKSVSALAHYTDWIIGHVHSGALGWNGFMAAGMFYFLVPKLYGRKLYSPRLANMHFYVGTFGIILYMASMWVAGITQGLMWRATNADGSLTYESFVETLLALQPMYWTRLVGGTLYLVGMIVMLYNLLMTARGARATDGVVDVVVERDLVPAVPWRTIVLGKPVVLTLVVGVLVGATAVVNGYAGTLFALTAVTVATLGAVGASFAQEDGKTSWHRLLEGRALLFTALTAIAVLIGGICELIPVLTIKPAEVANASDIQPYRALEVEGRDVYLREGCYTCHSQMIRPMVHETKRYGDVSTMADSMYDHPFQWGSKRTGPDLSREGIRNPSVLWHYQHMRDPRAVSPGSNMPPYEHMATSRVDFADIPAKMRALRSVGVPYTAAQIHEAQADAQAQADGIVAELKAAGAGDAQPDTQLVALISYLMRLGKVGPAPKPAPAVAASKPEVAPVGAPHEGGH